MAQKTQVPQQKTFSFAATVSDEKRDQAINDWRKDEMKKGNYPSPNAPVYFEDINGNSTYVCMFAEVTEI